MAQSRRVFLIASMLVVACLAPMVPAGYAADDLVPAQKLKGHTLFVEAVAFSPDGRLAVSGSRDKTVRLWDLESGKEIRRFEGHTTDVQAVAFSPDGKLIASGSGDRYAARDPNWPNDSSVRVWDVNSGKEVHRFQAHTFEACGLAFSPDGRTIASGGADHLCILWSLDTGRERARLPAQKGAVESVAFSPDGLSILSATDQGEVSLWNANTAEPIRTFGQSLGKATCVTFSDDGRLIASGHDHRIAAPSGAGLSEQQRNNPYPDCSVRIWEADSGKLLHRFGWNDTGPAGVAFSPDADRVGAIMPGAVRLWKLPEGQEIETVPLEGAAPAVIRVSPRGFSALIDNVDIWFYRSAPEAK